MLGAWHREFWFLWTIMKTVSKLSREDLLRPAHPGPGKGLVAMDHHFKGYFKSKPPPTSLWCSCDKQPAPLRHRQRLPQYQMLLWHSSRLFCSVTMATEETQSEEAHGSVGIYDCEVMTSDLKQYSYSEGRLQGFGLYLTSEKLINHQPIS